MEARSVISVLLDIEILKGFEDVDCCSDLGQELFEEYQGREQLSGGVQIYHIVFFHAQTSGYGRFLCLNLLSFHQTMRV